MLFATGHTSNRVGRVACLYPGLYCRPLRPLVPSLLRATIGCVSKTAERPTR